MIAPRGTPNSDETKTNTTKAYWMKKYNREEPKYSERDLPFRDLIDRYVPRASSCFEIGYYPCQFLIYLGERLGCTVGGIDWAPGSKSRAEQALASRDIKINELVEANFLDYHSTARYDLVCSFGFIEHFDNIEDILRRHVELVRIGGLLIVSCPNFRKTQLLLHKWLDAENLRSHNTQAMDLSRWAVQLRGLHMTPIHEGYWGTFGFWAEEGDAEPRARRWIAESLRRSGKIVSRIVDFPTSMLSPHMISIWKKF